jgi:hypothetical protein
MRKINIQRDLESRRNMTQVTVPAKEFETTTTEAIKEEANAESETVPGDTDNTVAPSVKKPEKRKRTSGGDVPALPL